MKQAIKILIDNIDRLATWLNENPNVAMPSQYKQKAQTVLQLIINGESLSEQEWQKLKPEVCKNAETSRKESYKKKASRKKKAKARKNSNIQKAHIVRGGLPGQGKRR